MRDENGFNKGNYLKKTCFCVNYSGTKHAVMETDEARCYRSMNRTDDVVCHSRRKFVDGTVHPYGIKSFWARVQQFTKERTTSGVDGIYRVTSMN
ncbi:MAG: hypothetical protein OXC61_08120 [Flavobacteriaceae bacterium]|nr:hypothetical protein [Flavobacteriaceae bacterium]